MLTGTSLSRSEPDTIPGNVTTDAEDGIPLCFRQTHEA